MTKGYRLVLAVSPVLATMIGGAAAVIILSSLADDKSDG